MKYGSIMLKLDIPVGLARLEHLVSDCTGTSSFDGKLLPGVKERLNGIAGFLKISPPRCRHLRKSTRRTFPSRLRHAKTEVDKELAPDGNNIGINDGPAAGQTILHLQHPRDSPVQERHAGPSRRHTMDFPGQGRLLEGLRSSLPITPMIFYCLRKGYLLK